MALHLAASAAYMIDSSSPDHPTDETVAAYLESVLPASERALLETHLRGCEYCRARLMLAGRALHTAPRTLSGARRLRRTMVGLAAAASVAGILLLSRPAERPVAEPSEIRAAELEADAPALRTIGPRRSATVDGDTLHLIWASLGPDVLYQVTVSAVDGKMLWTERTTDTIAAPSGEMLQQLRPGQRYFWRVDALLPTLRSVTSGDQPFQVSP
jgi:Putative zinc-finger